MIWRFAVVILYRHFPGGTVTGNEKLVRFEVITAASMKIAVFWVVAPCKLVDVYQRFRGTCCLHHQDDE
jgi:hypothetical protein